jgi:DNA-binding winged helix-turn-helix (wHTH) protein/Tol biopolymer transport system component
MRKSGPSRNSELLEFADFKIDLRSGELHRNGSVVRLQRQPFEILAHLAGHAGEIVSREELRQRLWQNDTFVDFDNGLNAAISKVREALADSAEQPRFVETLPRRGYRFIAEVRVIDPNHAGRTFAKAEPATPVHDAVTAATSCSVIATPPASPRRRQRYLVFAALLALVALVAVATIEIWHSTRDVHRLAIEQRLTANPPEAPITAAVVSPDGRYLAYADPTGVYIRQIEGGETRPLQSPVGLYAAPSGWFPDGTHLLLNAEGAGGTVSSLWKISILGGGPQMLVENAGAGVVSPDGSKIAFLRSASERLEVWIASSEGSDPRRIVENAGPEEFTGAGSLSNRLYTGFMSRLAWSPEGNRLAYIRSYWPAYPDPTMDNRRALTTVNVNDGTRNDLMESAQLRPAVCWSADGRLLYAFRDDTSDRNDIGVWSVRVDENSGELEGKPRQLTKGIGRIGGISVTADGKRLVLWRSNTEPTVFLADIDSESRHFRTPRRLTLDENMNVASEWTPDSRAVLFASNRHGNWKLFRQAIDQATPDVLAEGDFLLPRLNPDGTEILYMTGYHPEDPKHIGDVMSIPLRGGTRRIVLRQIPIGNIQCARIPSKLCLLNTSDGSTMKFFSFDAEGGTSQEFAAFKMTHALGSSLSPDGSQLAMVYPHSESKVTFMATSDKRTHDVELKEWASVNSIYWTGDSKSVYVVAQTANGTDAVLEVEPSGNHRVVLEGDNHTHIWWAHKSPDGQRAFIEEVAGENNVWMVENF